LIHTATASMWPSKARRTCSIPLPGRRVSNASS
jgi:hypothetical protein